VEVLKGEVVMLRVSMGTLRCSVEARCVQELQLAGRDDACGPVDQKDVRA
jgi:hypothetical protein